MPRVLVITDQGQPGNRPVLLDERVNSVHLSTDQAAMQFVERLGWAISDAEEAERADLPTPAPSGASGRRRGSSGARSRARSPVTFGDGRKSSSAGIGQLATTGDGRSSSPAAIGQLARTPSPLRG